MIADALKQNFFPVKTLLIAMVATLLTLIWLGVASFNGYSILQNSLDRDIHIAELRGSILHLDEVLTMSARMAAVTSDKKWIERYNHYEPILEQSIKRAILLAPEAYQGDAAERTDKANIELVAMERKAFALVLENKLQEAQQLLASDEYENHKNIYKSGMDDFARLLNESASKNLAEGAKNSYYILINIGFVSVFLCLIWLLVLKHLRSWKRDVEAAHLAVEQANQTKAEFLYSITHELRTPMHAILRFSENGIDESKSGKRGQLQEYFEDIHLSGKRLTRLVDNLLDMSKIEVGKVQLHFEEGSVTNAVEHALKEVSILSNDKDLSFIFKKTDDLPEVWFDQDKIIQVIINLISNAIKFSPKGGVITVSAEVSSIGNDNIGTAVKLSVADEGEGVHQDEIGIIFEKYTQSSLNKRKEKGAGLGLAISKQVVELHNGYIWAENKPEGGGAVFSFTIPLIQEVYDN